MKEKKYLILYYLSFVMTILFTIFASYKSLELLSLDNNGDFSLVFENGLALVNLIIVIVFSVLLLKKKKLIVENVLFPAIYLCFLIIIVALCFLFNNKVMVLYMHFGYYSFFINIGYLFLNIYSLLLIKYK